MTAQIITRKELALLTGEDPSYLSPYSLVPLERLNLVDFDSQISMRDGISTNKSTANRGNNSSMDENLHENISSSFNFF
ncbi:unnamed protein product, partial [Rotaria magnacalcarata]